MCEVLLPFQNKENFVDDSFIPSDKSLYIKGNSKKDEVQWLRPVEITSQYYSEKNIPWKVLRTPQPSDISQGVLGNCWSVIRTLYIDNLHDYIYALIYS